MLDRLAKLIVGLIPHGDHAHLVVGVVRGKGSSSQPAQTRQSRSRGARTQFAVNVAFDAQGRVIKDEADSRN